MSPSSKKYLLGTLYNQTVNVETDSKTLYYGLLKLKCSLSLYLKTEINMHLLLKQQPQKSYEQDILPKIFKSINHQVYILRDPCYELFCVFEDFYVSETQDAEVTNSLQL